LGFGHLFNFPPVGSLRGGRYLPRPPVSDPQGDVNRFRENLDQLYGSVHPPLYRGIYSQALEEAKRDLRFLLVYLHCPSHQDTDDFCKNVICSPELINFVSEHVIFWACSVDSGEGYRGAKRCMNQRTHSWL